MNLARIKLSGYENIVVDCPICNREIILNRASDLGSFEPIAGISTNCPECKGEFWLNGDRISERHKALIFDCHDLLRDKKYMNCILNVCQSYEIFFGLYLRVNLLYRPFNSDLGQRSVSGLKLNQLHRKLFDNTEKFGFIKMRSAALSLAVAPTPPSTLVDAEKHIETLSRSKLPSDAELDALHENKIARLLIRIRQVRINKLRNNVIHKVGYRPKHEEAETALEEARSILFPLTHLLNLHDDINWYYQRT